MNNEYKLVNRFYETSLGIILKLTDCKHLWFLGQFLTIVSMQS